MTISPNVQLALKYRPITWDDMVGQHSTTKIIQSMILKNQIHHFLLFSGTRGSGKTSAARLLARTLNCSSRRGYNPCNECENCKAALTERSTDIIEMDAASNGDVEAARQIKEMMLYPPMHSPFRVIIFDEAHAMTKRAFDVLLKTLEEPPPHTYFIMATTESHKIPDTVLSRSIPFEFRRISTIDIHDRLKHVADLEKIEVAEDAIWALASHSEGGVRNALTSLEQLALSGSIITEDMVTSTLGILGRQEVHKLFEAYLNNDNIEVQLWLRTTIRKGTEPSIITATLLRYTTELISAMLGHRGEMTEETFTQLSMQARKMGKERLTSLLTGLLTMESRLGNSLLPSGILIDSYLHQILITL